MIIQGNSPYTQASFSLRNRVGRQLWNLVWMFLFRPSPRVFHAWRAFLLRLFGAQLGRRCHIYPAAKVWAPWNLRMGDHVLVGDGANLYNMDLIELGSYAVISQGAHLCGGSHDYNSPNLQLFALPIRVGSHAWVCAEAFIAPGMTVAEGAVVGARSVVTRPLLEPWAVYAGSPCRKVGQRQKHACTADTAAGRHAKESHP